MSEIVGYVASEHGIVEVTRENGETVALKSHMPVHKNDIIQTGDTSSVALVLDNGNTITIGENKEIVLDETVYEAKNFDSDEVQTSAKAVQELLALDGNAELDETGAGNESISSSLAPAGNTFLSIEENLGHVESDYLPTQIARAVEPLPFNDTTPLILPEPIIATIAPTANDDSSVGNTPGSVVIVNVLANDSDDNALDPTSVKIVAIYSGGSNSNTSLTVPGEGVWSVDPVNGTITFTPEDGFTGNPSPIHYTVDDNEGNTSNPATVTIDYDILNAPPVAVDDATGTNQNIPVTIPVLSNDSDPDGDPLQVTEVTDGAHGVVTLDPNSGNPVYTPNPGFIGTDTFTYTISDGHGGFDTATVTVTINAPVTPPPSNTPPHAANDAIVTDEDIPVVIAVLNNDNDSNGDPLSVIAVTNGANGTVTIDPVSGNPIYTPNENFNGEDTFTYTISDGHGGFDTATVTVTVNPVNDAPTAEDDTAATQQNTPVVIDVLDNDNDVENALDPTTLTIITPPMHGTLEIDPVSGAVTYTPDPDYQGSDQFEYSVADNEGVVSNPAVVNIVVGDISTLSIDDVTVNEDAAEMVFTLTLSQPSDVPVSVDYITVPGTASEGDDYTPVSGTVTFSPGSVTQTIAVPVIDDALFEGNETLNVMLSNPVNVLIADGTGLGIIQDEPTPGAEDSIDVILSGDANVAEGEAATYTITLSKPAVTDMDVDVVIGHETTDNGDLLPVTMTVTVPAGAATVDFTINNLDDAYAEGDETYTVALSGITTGGGFEAVNVDTTPVTTVISDNSPQDQTIEPDAEVMHVLLSGEGNVIEGGSATYTVSVDEPVRSPMTVEVQVGHTTTDNGDLIPTTMSVTIPTGATSAEFTVVTLNDDVVEALETYSVALTGVTDGGGFESVEVDTTPLSTTIVDDDGIASLIIDDVTVNEDAGVMTFTVTLSSTTTEDVTFDYASADNGSAEAGSDYSAVSGSGTIAAGTSSTTIVVPIIDDYIAEGAETFVMNLSNVSSNAVIADNQGIGTILDESNPTAEDGITVTLSGDTAVEEGNDAVYTISTDKPVASDLSVTIITGHVTTEDGDYVPLSTVVTIAAGERTADFSVTTNDDAYAEGSEEYTVTMSEPVGGGVESVTLGNTVVTTAIVDEISPAAEDTATVNISGTTTVAEGESATYTVAVDVIPLEDLHVTIVVGNITTENGDVTPLNVSVTIAAGETSASFSIDTIQDMSPEATEEFMVSIDTVEGGGFENTLLGVSSVTTAITDASHPPVATDNNTTTSEDTPITVNVLENDSDP
ncbi:MAG: hypothetical protein DSZ03_02705, partial [Sulfurimonas sp.]